MYGIKTKIKAAMGIEKRTTEEKSSNEERVHTPTSLYAKLFSYLEEKELIIEVNNTSDLDKLLHGSFVRFESKLEKKSINFTFGIF